MSELKVILLLNKWETGGQQGIGRQGSAQWQRQRPGRVAAGWVGAWQLTRHDNSSNWKMPDAAVGQTSLCRLRRPSFLRSFARFVRGIFTQRDRDSRTRTCPENATRAVRRFRSALRAVWARPESNMASAKDFTFTTTPYLHMNNVAWMSMCVSRVR